MPEQRRALNLYKTARSVTVLGQHKVLTFQAYDVNKSAPLNQLKRRFDLYQGEKNESRRTLIAKNISLQEIYANHIQDGKMLYMAQRMEKRTMNQLLATRDEGLLEGYEEVALVNSHTHSTPIKPAVAKSLGRSQGPLKVIIFTIISPPAYVRMVLDRAYQFIESGSPVEMRTRLQSQKLSKEERVRAGDPTTWPWIHQYFPHLRPDFILKSMPEGTEYFVKPVSDGRIVQWVMGKKAGNRTQRVDVTKRLFTVKASVQKAIAEGQQAMLPKIMREQLRETGNLNYSTNTALPREQARLKFGSDKPTTYGGEEKKGLKKDAVTDGFMVPTPGVVAEKPVIRYQALPVEGALFYTKRGKVKK
ncbi:hypothetical protein GMOD_00001150 [Pyrenophora seminiperda CCB06]|uniref:Uncharacterized protein n=1 Tax=Pyrenophora seminiperda CCB06 TaxID=1302712 RepID=A0A3M7LYN6_9PLEO|nr:hypothetical protein GMOD_00001150 [Pyrenophora seminiperda CCB06]